MLTVTNPTTSAVSQSPIQLQGYASHPLDSLSFDVSNAAGIFTNQTGFLTGQFYDTNLLAYTTNYFECSGIVLNSGTNIITLHATDWAGNTANVSFALDYSPDTNPPELNLVWPQDGTTISGSHFTLQAQVSDPTATVTASVNGNTAQGLVEQNGSVWVQNLSLNAGTNAVTLTASNAFGGVSVTHFNVIGNDVGLVINPLTSDQMNQSSVNVTGSINDPSDTVTVNGIQANVDSETGAWEADNVPVSPTGTASLNAQVGDSSNNPLASQTVNQPQPAMVVLAGYSGFINENGSFFASRFWPFLEVHTINWAYDSGGNETDSGYVPNDAGTAENYFDWPDSLPADGPGFASPDLGLAWDYFSVNTPYGDGGNFQRSSKAQVMIVPSGQVQAGTTNVYLVLTCASEYSNPVQDFGGGPGDLPLPPEWLQNNGQTLVNTGITNTDGAVWGASTASGLSGTPVLLKTIATQHYLYNAFSLSNRVFQLVSQCVATTPSNQARTNLGVGKLVNLSFIPALPTTNITWSATAGGLNVTSGVTNLFTAPNNATNVTITATVGSMPISFRFKVLEPSYETSVKYGPDDTFPANTIPPTYGAGMSLLITENPTTVSFAKVQMTELAGPASNITGIFTNLDPMSLYHWPSNSVVGVTNSWIKINSLNQWGDHSSFSIQASPVFPGGFDLVIPVRWRVGSNGVENIFPSRLVTARITDTNGSAIDTKLGQEAHNP
jgi:hypothetical protein